MDEKREVGQFSVSRFREEERSAERAVPMSRRVR